jgi:hypothetical protein
MSANRTYRAITWFVGPISTIFGFPLALLQDGDVCGSQGAHELISAAFAFAGSLQGYAIEVTVNVVSRIGI